MKIFLTVLILAGSGFLPSSLVELPNDEQVIFPRAFGIAVNQVGYMNGSNIGENSNGPFRAGIRRNFDVRDYKPIAEIGKEVGVRFMTLFALAEMDRLNVVANYPTATYQGADFDNSENIGPAQLEIMDYVKQNASHLEFAVTGVGVEYWENGTRTRGEWYDFQNRQPRPEAEMRGRMELMKQIMAQYGISEENGHSFPESMGSYGYHWNPGGEISTGKIWAEHGVKYVNSKFTVIRHLNTPPDGTGGFDNGVLVFDRFTYGNAWNAYAALPEGPVDQYETDLIDSHWPNWLAADDYLQPRLNREWIQYFRTIQEHPNHYLAKNTEQLYSQWLYNRYAQVHEEAPGRVVIDNLGMAEEAYEYDMLGNMVLKIPLEAGSHVSRAELDGEPISAYFEEAGFGFIYLPKLEKDVYLLEYEIGPSMMSRYVNNTGTYNVYKVENSDDRFLFDLKMYGTQEVRIKTDRPRDVISDNDNLQILSSRYDNEAGLLFLEIKGRNIQGESGQISLLF